MVELSPRSLCKISSTLPLRYMVLGTVQVAKNVIHGKERLAPLLGNTLLAPTLHTPRLKASFKAGCCQLTRARGQGAGREPISNVSQKFTIPNKAKKMAS